MFRFFQKNSDSSPRIPQAQDAPAFEADATATAAKTIAPFTTSPSSPQVEEGDSNREELSPFFPSEQSSNNIVTYTVYILEDELFYQELWKLQFINHPVSIQFFSDLNSFKAAIQSDLSYKIVFIDRFIDGIDLIEEKIGQWLRSLPFVGPMILCSNAIQDIDPEESKCFNDIIDKSDFTLIDVEQLIQPIRKSHTIYQQ